MKYEVVPLTPDDLQKLLAEVSPELRAAIDARAYFSPGSVAFCLKADGNPAFCGGVVNMEWRRAEAWLLPTLFFRTRLLTSMRAMRECLPDLAARGHFIRVQAVCAEGISGKLFRHLGFDYEGTLRKFGPGGETCDLYARVFEGTP
jgi:hypothetical protein